MAVGQVRAYGRVPGMQGVGGRGEGHRGMA